MSPEHLYYFSTPKGIIKDLQLYQHSSLLTMEMKFQFAQVSTTNEDMIIAKFNNWNIQCKIVYKVTKENKCNCLYKFLF